VSSRVRACGITGWLAAGTRLVEDSLAAQFGVSRGPIRDAMRRLDLEFHSRFYAIACHRRLTAVWESYPTFAGACHLRIRGLIPVTEGRTVWV